MSDREFPLLSELGRPNIIMDAVLATGVPKKGGIVIVSGMRGTGISTTLAAIGHELKNRAYDVVHIQMPETEVFPGLDSISAPNANFIMGYTLSHKNPEVVILDYSYNVEVFELAAFLAGSGSLVILGRITDTAEDAVDNFIKSITINPYIQDAIRKLVKLTIHQTNTIATYNAYSTQERILLNNVDEALALLAECNPDRYYGKNGGMYQLQFTVQQYF